MSKSSRVVAGVVLACLVAAPAVAQQAPAAVQKLSSAKDRTEVSITVYNQNFGLVREVRDVDVSKGRVALEFRDVASQIQPETVSIKSLAGAAAINVLEQNYRYDLLTPEKLLEKYVGKKVRIYRWNEKLGKEDAFDAEVLSVNGGQSVFKIGGEITYGFPGRLAFPEVPANLIAKPTLVWLVDSAAPKQKLEVTYLTRGMGWKADYVLVLDDKDQKGDLTGWVTLTNNSGTSYENAKLKLVAGDVQKIVDSPGYYKSKMPVAAAAPSGGAGFKEEGFFEYHLYTLQKPTDVLQNEQKQVTLLEAEGVPLLKKLIFFGAAYYYRGSYGQVVSNQKVGVYLDIENKEQNKLGIPLPKGIVRVYKADKSGAKQFVGEDRIDHTPRDEKIRIKMGEAFDVVGDRKQMNWKTLGTCSSESDWEISLRNHKDTDETVELYEPIGGDWELVSQSHPSTKKDAHTFTFTVKVPKKGETKVKYRVRVRWC
ncbi:MAG: DUF4139 domain-containing protein [Deltaproteobacteria bacterium]|nr:DUF4139 domain-containing protein [Deltaproteobacteria bacterium]